MIFTLAMPLMLAGIVSAAASEECIKKAEEIFSECNQECPLDVPANAACHLACQIQYDAAVRECERD